MKLEFYDNDPDNGGKRISYWEAFERSGLLKRFEGVGIHVAPTHSFKLLKTERQKLFVKLKDEFIEQRKIEDVETKASDLNEHFILWLESELNQINKWLNTPSTAASDRIELGKYQKFIAGKLGMARNPNNLEPLPKHEQIDFLGQAKQLEPTYAERLQKWMDKRPECDEGDFINSELEIWNNQLTPDQQWTEGPKWDRYKAVVKKYLSFLRAMNTNKPQLNTKTRSTENQEPKNFIQAFHNPDRALTYIEMLKKVEPPIIDEEGRYRLGPRQKGAIVAWITILQDKGFLKKINDKQLAELLNEQFPGLELGKSARTLRNPQTTAYTKYHNQLLAILT